MSPTFDHLALTSFYLFLNQHIQNKGGGYILQTGVFYPYVDPKTSLKAYGTSYPSFVYDSYVSGANVLASVYSGVATVGRPTIKIDYPNGRILTSGAPTSITGSFWRQEINLYMNEGQETVLVEKAFNLARERVSKPLTYIPPGSVVAPFINLSYATSYNEGFALGGQDKTTLMVRATVLTDNNYRAAAILSLLRDLNQKCFSYISNSNDLPFDYYGDLKNGTWNYNSVAATYNEKIFIEKVNCSRISEIFNEQNDNFFLATAEIELWAARYPRQ